MFIQRISIVMVLVMMLIVACQNSTPDNCRLSEQDIADIHTLYKSHEENAMAGDWVADSQLYSEDAIRLTPGGEPVKGRAPILEFLETIDTVLSFTTEIVELDGGGDIAYVWVNYNLSEIFVGSTEPVEASGKALVIIKRQPDNSWKFHRMMWD